MKKEAPELFDAVPKDELQKQLALARYGLAAALDALDREDTHSGLPWRETPAARAYRQVLADTAPPEPEKEAA